MKMSLCISEQIAFALRQAQGGAPVLEVCRKMGIAEQTFYLWNKRFVGMGVVEVRRLKVLDEWAYRRGVKLNFIRPGKPVEKAFPEFQRPAA